MNSISSVSNPLVQQQISSAISLGKDSVSSAAISDPNQFAASFMNSLQKASTVSSPISSFPSSISTITTSPSSTVSASDRIGSSIDKLIQTVDQKQKDAAIETKKVLAGESDNLHQSVIKMQEAGVAFSLMIEVRNKLIESYQELMRTSV